MELMALDIMLATLFMEGFNMNKSIKFILRVLLFIIIFIPCFIYITYLCKPINYNLYNISGLYSEDKKSLDVVYIGGSAAFVYFEPLKAFEEYGFTTYDYACDTIQAELYKYMIKEILKNQDPEVIIIDARAFQYRDKDQVPTEVAYRNYITGMPFSINRFNLIEDVVKNYLKEDTLSYHFDIIKYHGRDGVYDYYESFKLMNNNYNNKFKGFYFVPSVEPITKTNYFTERITPVSEETNAILDDLLEYLKTTNRKYLFVVSPYEELESHKENFNYVEDKVKKAGYNFVDANDYRDEMNLNYNTDFYNYNHVNIFGAEKYTEFLSKYLVNNYNLKDRRGKSNFDKYIDEWNDNVQNTKKEIKKIIEERLL